MNSDVKNSFIMEIENVSATFISGTLKNGDVSGNSIVYANGIPYTVENALKNKKKKSVDNDKDKSVFNFDIALKLRDAQPDNFSIGDIVSTNKDISLGLIPSNIHDKSACNFCGSILTMEGKLYVCDRCGAVFNRKEIEE